MTFENLVKKTLDKKYDIRISKYGSENCIGTRTIKEMSLVPTKEFKNVTLLNLESSYCGLVHFITENDELVVVPWAMIVSIMPSVRYDSSQIVENMKWFLFDDESKEIKNEMGFSHGLQFVTWAGNGQSFIVKDTGGIEYRVSVSRA